MRLLGGILRVAGATSVAAGVSLMGASAASAATSCATLPATFQYSEWTSGLASETHGDSDGPTAFGGGGTLSNFAIATNSALIPASNVGFVAGGAVNGGSTTAVHLGDAYTDANLIGVSVQTGTLHQVAASGLPLDFTGSAAAATAFSSQLAALPTSAGDLKAFGGSTLTLTSTQTESDNQYVWDLTAADLATATTIAIVGVPAGGTIVVNIPLTGTVAPSVATVTLDGASSSPTTGSAPALASSTIFNFSGASSLTLKGTWSGALFAPAANVTFSNGHVWGSIAAATLTGTNESTYGPLGSGICADLTGPGTSLPETPWAAALPILGVALIGGVVVYRRRSHSHR